MLRNESLASTQDVRLRGHTNFKNVVRMCLLNFFHINWLAKIFNESSKNTVPHATQTEFIYSIHSKRLKMLLKAKGSQSNSAIILQIVQQGAKLIPGCRAHQAGSWLAGRLSVRKLACMVYLPTFGLFLNGKRR